ncbi:MAG: hypothetical protein K6F01_03910 [Selenomonas sp.]|uniref:hypothetical protein n=1 Tax=Selenomonas sp. TaxID=2053611 RepID=UPI0025F9183A|nr:hypothetical protein [Selenomonas sp.]MCR5438565.1 hypothetical protein [Selenomonas sp.]
MDVSTKSLYQYSMNALFILFLFLLPFQDSGLSETALNYVGLYLSNIPLIIMVLLSSFYAIYRRNIMARRLYVIIGVFAYVIVFSLLMCLWVNEEITISLYKTITGCISLFLQVYVFYVCRNRLPLIKKYIWIAFLIDMLGWGLCDVLKVDMGWIIHRSLGDERFHGFASETSWFSFTTMILGLLSIEASDRKYLKIIYAISMIGVVLLGGSKGTVLCLMIAAIVGILLNDNVNIFFKPLLILTVGIVGYVVFQNLILDSFVHDLSDATSFATRVSSILASVMIVIDYPFGTGYGAFQSILREYYVDAFDLLNSYVPLFSLSAREILWMVNDTTGSGLSIKGIFFQYMAYFGLPFFMFVILSFWRFSKYELNNYWKVSAMFVVIGLLCFANFYYDSILFFAVLAKNIKRENQKTSIVGIL